MKPNTARPRKLRPVVTDPTRNKLIEAAGRVFAERGFEAATVREICLQAGANVAAVNYYFRDKLGLYSEVLHESVRAAKVETFRAALERHAPTEETLRAVIRMRLRSAHQADLPDWHFRIMAHELAHPTPAMSHIIRTVSKPIYERFLKLIGEIIGRPANHEKTLLCTQSIMGQIFLYVLAGPVLAQLAPQLKMNAEQVDRIADHIADFSLAYLRELHNRGRKAPGSRSAGRSQWQKTKRR